MCDPRKALELGSELICLDEDTVATNCEVNLLIRPSSRSATKTCSPILPFPPPPPSPSFPTRCSPDPGCAHATTHRCGIGAYHTSSAQGAYAYACAASSLHVLVSALIRGHIITQHRQRRVLASYHTDPRADKRAEYIYHHRRGRLRGLSRRSGFGSANGTLPVCPLFLSLLSPFVRLLSVQLVILTHNVYLASCYSRH